MNLRCFYEANDIDKVMKKMLMIYEGKVEPIDSIDFDIVANEMEEKVENGDENIMVANEDDNEDDEDYETPEATKERKKKVERRKKHYNSSVNYFKETKTMKYL